MEGVCDRGDASYPAGGCFNTDVHTGERSEDTGPLLSRGTRLTH